MLHKSILIRKIKDEMQSNIYPAKNIQEILYQMRSIASVELICGGTYERNFPEKGICTRNIPELMQINKHERYIDFGPSVPLNRILEMGKNRIPAVLYEAVASVSNHFIRHVATIGGNVCAKDRRLTLFAPLLAMNAMLRFRNQEGIQNIEFSKFDHVQDGNLLINIRVPDEDWDVSIFKRLGPPHIVTDETASFCFLAKTANANLINLRIAFAGKILVASRELENRLLGMKLPISASIISDFIKNAGIFFDRQAEGIDYNPILKQQFLNLTQYSLSQLT